MDEKANKRDLEMLEQMLLARINEILNGLGNQFAEKEPVRKKLLAIEKNVSAKRSVTADSSRTCTTW